MLLEGTAVTSANMDEAQREAAAINHLLGEIGLARNERDGWWNFVAYEALGGRTPTQAWLAGETEAVRSLVETWYSASKAAVDRASHDADFVAELRRKLAAVDERVQRHGPIERSA